MSLVLNLVSNGRITETFEELLLDEEFYSEAAFEDEIAQNIGSIIPSVGAGELLVIGRQVSLKAGGGRGRGLTLDLLVLDEDAAIHVVEIKIKQDKFSVGQAYSYAAILRDGGTEALVATYQQYASEHLGRSLSEAQALAELATHCGVYPEDFCLQDANPGIVVITPSVSREECAVAEALTTDGNRVVIVQPRLFQHDNEVVLAFNRFFPALEPGVEGRPSTARRQSVSTRWDGSDKRSTMLVRAIFEYLTAAAVQKRQVTLSELRQKTGQSAVFTEVVRELENAGFLASEEINNSKRGRNPIVVSMTAEGVATHKQMNASTDEP